MKRPENNAIKTNSLIERINQNQNFQSIDINEWAFNKIRASNEKLNILELCCGTGKQTKYLLELFPKATISCLDISVEATETVKNSFGHESFRMFFYNQGIDDFFQTNNDCFDVIFVSYGLYYSQNIEFVLDSIYKSLNDNGRLIVMGPFGKNNKQLFDVLSQLSVTIPQPVLHSSSKFMYETVLEYVVNEFKENHVYTTHNRIEWKAVDSVMSYWKSSTFYNPDKENQFEDIVKNEIQKNHVFVNDKHIMLLEAVK